MGWCERGEWRLRGKGWVGWRAMACLIGQTLARCAAEVGRGPRDRRGVHATGRPAHAREIQDGRGGYRATCCGCSQQMMKALISAGSGITGCFLPVDYKGGRIYKSIPKNMWRIIRERSVYKTEAQASWGGPEPSAKSWSKALSQIDNYKPKKK